MAPKPPTTPDTSNPQGDTLAIGALAEEHLHLDGSAIDRISGLARQAMPTIAIGKEHRPCAIVSKDFALIPIPEADAERDAPRRIKVAHHVNTVDAFVAYLERFKNEATLIYGNADTGTMVAIIDHPTKEKPSFADHGITFEPRETEAWKVWDAIDGKALTQAQMALFLEENYVDIIEPDGATMLELAKNIEASKAGAFRSAVNLSNGSRILSWDEKTDGQSSVGGNKVAIPTKILLRLPIYDGQGSTDVHVLFRYRIDSGKLAMQFDIWRKPQVVRTAFDQLVKQVRDATSLSVIDGVFDAPKRIDPTFSASPR